MILMGLHHAREHLSSEIAIMFVEHLLGNKSIPAIAELLDKRDLWILPMVNPDGGEFDIKTGVYQYWRKNRRNNGDFSFGVDLNRNYGFQWGTGGSSKFGFADTFMGKQPFSEPETQAVRDFIKNLPNVKVLLSLHTFSELVLYPWGHTKNKIADSKDIQIFETMAKTMAKWNGYKPMQSSGLYIASGDTCDWAYGELGIYAFTFELSPASSLGAQGFYPGAQIIDRVFQANIKPFLYMLELADDPARSISGPTFEREFLPSFDSTFSHNP
jgi:carboxypeptidase T